MGTRIQGLTRMVLALLGLSISLTAASDDNLHFSPHQNTITMPGSWVEQPVIYDSGDKNADLVISLGQQTYPALHQAIRKYARDNKLNIVIHQGSCGISAGRLMRKKVDVAAFCCPPGKTDRLPDLEFHTVAITPIALLTHKDNPLQNISLEQARDIFRGKHKKWGELINSDNRFKGMHISPVGRLHCKVRPGHWRTLLDDESKFSPSLFEVGVIPDMLEQIKSKSQSIGYETPFMVKHYRLRDQIKSISVNGYSPHNPDNVLSGKYPFYRTYNLTTWSNKHNNKLAKPLVNHVINYIENNYEKYEFVPKSRLLKAGWKFSGNELVGTP